mmetsp:Transcript_26543/g.54349  ORF Transcript_26543/g.54349 Transcript_26543/m.54349 type:complete len:301 (-) Transcript_26543:195-1097(-)
MVLDETKDVVVLFHASKGCESCAHMAVYYKRVYQRLCSDLGLCSHDPFGEVWRLADVDLARDLDTQVLPEAKKQLKRARSPVWRECLKARRRVLLANLGNQANATAADAAAAAAGPTKAAAVPNLVIARMDVSDEAPPNHFNFNLKTLPALVILPAKDKGQPYRFFSGVAKVLEMMKWVASEASEPIQLPPLAHLRDGDHREYKRQVAEREKHRAEELERTEVKQQAETRKRKERLEAAEKRLRKKQEEGELERSQAAKASENLAEVKASHAAFLTAQQEGQEKDDDALATTPLSSHPEL